MAIGWLSRLAAATPPPVFAAVGPGLLPATERLLARPTLRRCGSPREAAILLVAGTIPEPAGAALDRVHDQLPHPRASFDWDGGGDAEAAIGALWRGLLGGGASEPDRLPDEPPNSWRGEGDHGQGGEGMMGGVPYGRPMAMTGDDLRDGLSLDLYTARIGPFAPMLPPGLQLSATLQGDLVVTAAVARPPFEQPAEADAPEACAARLLRLLGLGGDADRLLRGGRPRGLGALAAIPTGLAADAQGGDARARLRAWLGGEMVDVVCPDPGDLLVGLEWHEATLALASFPPSALRRATQAAEAA